MMLKYEFRRHRLGLKTSLAWLLLPLCLQGQSSVQLADASFRAFAEAGTDLLALSADGSLHRSTDGGITFTQQASAPTIAGDASAEFYGLGALGSTVVAVGIDGLIVRSLDSGQTWSSANAPVSFDRLDAVAARPDGSNPNQWLAVGADSFDAAIYRSTDDGANWTSVVTPPTDAALRSVLWTGSAGSRPAQTASAWRAASITRPMERAGLHQLYLAGPCPCWIATDGSLVLTVGEGARCSAPMMTSPLAPSCPASLAVLI